MLIVAVDTSSRAGSLALCRGDLKGFELLQLNTLEGGTYSAQLMPRIAETLRLNKLDKTQVDGFAVVSGPGSFTGLRVGLATLKGLCEVLRKPLAKVSMLEAVAIVHGRPNERGTSVLDAGRGELYVGEYQVPAAGIAKPMEEYIAKLDVFVAEARGNCGYVLTPDPKVAEALRTASINVKLVPAIQADEIGRIGIHKLITGDAAEPATIDVNYIRRSDAEIFAKPKC
jgi:tRNA threonylcarbamoyladenosine biosynthesis protein TsaB